MPKINVQSKPERFRRAGIEFTRAGVEVDTDKITKEQLEAIEAEPNLVVAAEESAAKPQQKAKGAK